MKNAIPRNVWVASVTSFLMDVSTEMVVNVLPLYLANVLGARTAVIGLIEGVAESTAGVLKLASGSLSDRLGNRKWPAVSGYALSALARPAFALATTWGGIAAARWADRVGKGVRAAPRDALLADSILPSTRGFAFGLHRAADTGGAVVGILVAIALVAAVQGNAIELDQRVFTLLVGVSLVPAFLAVLVLAVGATEPKTADETRATRAPLRSLGRPFVMFLATSALFDLAHFSGGFLVLRAQDRGLSVVEVLWALALFNVVSAFLAVPAGRASDRVGRKRLIVGGWMLYAIVCLGFAFTEAGRYLFLWFAVYGCYHALTIGATRAFIADLVPASLRGTAYGSYYAVLALIDLPASLTAGVLWEGVGSWHGFGPAAPFLFGAAMALAASLLLVLVVPESRSHRQP